MSQLNSAIILIVSVTVRFSLHLHGDIGASMPKLCLPPGSSCFLFFIISNENSSLSHILLLCPISCVPLFQLCRFNSSMFVSITSLRILPLPLPCLMFTLLLVLSLLLAPSFCFPLSITLSVLSLSSSHAVSQQHRVECKH